MYLYLLVLFLLISTFSKEPQLPNHVIPLYGNTSLGYYYANIYIGSPPQQQSVIVDTGSGQLALPCSKCLSCGTSHIHSPFRLSQSQTSKILTCNSDQEACRNSCGARSDSQACTFAISYAQGSSLSGIVIQDEIQFEGDSVGESIKTAFGCTTRETNLFFTQAANGIFGLAPIRQSKLFQKLHAKHSQKTGQQLIFSLCLSKNGGQLVVGKLRNEIHRDSQSVKTTYSRGQNLYSLDGVGEMRMGSKIIKSKNEFSGSFGIFIDSGATFTYLPSSNFKSLSIALQNACAAYPNKCLVGKSRQNCFKIQTEKNSTVLQTVTKIFPAFEIEIHNKVVAWSPADYFLLKSLKSKEVCIGIQSYDRFILGGNWMVNRDIAFNLMEATVQIFSNSRCEIQKSSNNKLLHQNKDQQKSIQSQQVTIPSPVKQEMVEYTGGISPQQISYINAIFRQDNNVTVYLIILICIIGGIIVLLIVASKMLPKQQKPAKQLKEQELQTMKSAHREVQNLNASEQLQNQVKNEEVHTEDIIVSQVK